MNNNKIETIRIHLPHQLESQSDYITDRIREGITERQYQGEAFLEHLSLGVIETHPHITADEIVHEILNRLDLKLEQLR